MRLLSLGRLRSRKTRIHNSVPLKRRRHGHCRVQEGAFASVAFRRKEGDTASVALSGTPSDLPFFSKVVSPPRLHLRGDYSGGDHGQFSIPILIIFNSKGDTNPVITPFGDHGGTTCAHHARSSFPCRPCPLKGVVLSVFVCSVLFF